MIKKLCDNAYSSINGFIENIGYCLSFHLQIPIEEIPEDEELENVIEAQISNPKVCIIH